MNGAKFEELSFRKGSIDVSEVYPRLDYCWVENYYQLTPERVLRDRVAEYLEAMRRTHSKQIQLKTYGKNLPLRFAERKKTCRSMTEADIRKELAAPLCRAQEDLPLDE